MTTQAPSLGVRLAWLRRAAGYTLVAVEQRAKREGLEINYTTISRFESGERVPSAEQLAVLAKVYGSSADYLLGMTDTPARTTPRPALQLALLPAAPDTPAPSPSNGLRPEVAALMARLNDAPQRAELIALFSRHLDLLGQAPPTQALPPAPAPALLQLLRGLPEPEREAALLELARWAADATGGAQASG